MSRYEPDKPSVLIFYHYFHPDDVVSARHLTDLATGLAEKGCDVEAMPSNRSCRTDKVFAKSENYRHVAINRIFRPGFKQATTLGRLLNLTWMILAWSLAAFRRSPNVLIIGTDPIFSILVALPWKLIRPKTQILHWCFDLYPDAAEESAIIARHGRLAQFARWLRNAALKRCTYVVDIGSCMRKRLGTPAAQAVTLVPWALLEPDQPLAVNQEERRKVFGEAQTTIMYSGNFGEAHAFAKTLQLARQWRGEDVAFAFSIRGNKVEELRSAIQPADTNINFVEFADESRLAQRLACTDLHLITLSEGWQGIVVPSKFFGALAIGRPVLFEGPKDSAVYEWIKQHQVGFHIDDLPASPVEMELPTPEHCQQTYHRYFSYPRQLEGWNDLVNRSINQTL